MATLLLAIAASPAAADLRYTTHIETRKAESAQPVDPIMGMIGAMLASRFPSGDMTMTVGNAGTRVEFANALGPVPAGGVMLIRMGSTVILNPVDRTYWTARTPTPVIPGSAAPTVTAIASRVFERPSVQRAGASRSWLTCRGWRCAPNWGPDGAPNWGPPGCEDNAP